jgi:hypothetical protein
VDLQAGVLDEAARAAGERELAELDQSCDRPGDGAGAF